MAKAEFSNEALVGYAKWGLDNLSYYAWEGTKFGGGLVAAGFGLPKAYEFVTQIPYLHEAAAALSGVENSAPQVAGYLAIGLGGWAGKRVVDRFIAHHAPEAKA